MSNFIVGEAGLVLLKMRDEIATNKESVLIAKQIKLALISRNWTKAEFISNYAPISDSFFECCELNVPFHSISIRKLIATGHPIFLLANDYFESIPHNIRVKQSNNYLYIYHRAFLHALIRSKKPDYLSSFPMKNNVFFNIGMQTIKYRASHSSAFQHCLCFFIGF